MSRRISVMPKKPTIEETGEEAEPDGEEEAHGDEADPETPTEIGVAPGQEDVGEDREQPEEIGGAEITAGCPEP
jgi:hypothetical protein